MFWNLETTATSSGAVSVCIDLTGVTFQEGAPLRLLHLENNAWRDVTTSGPTGKVICGNATSLGLFTVARLVQTFAYFTNTETGISVVDTKTNQVVPSQALAGGFIPAATFSPDGSRVYIANNFVKTIVAYNAFTHRIIATIPLAGNPRHVAFSPDGALAYAVTEDGVIAVINTSTHAVINSLPVVDEFFTAIAISNDGRKAYLASASGHGNAHVIDLLTGVLTPRRIR
jgi:YVTN family beta-propeller protein